MKQNSPNPHKLIYTPTCIYHYCNIRLNSDLFTPLTLHVFVTFVMSNFVSEVGWLYGHYPYNRDYWYCSSKMKCFFPFL